MIIAAIIAIVLVLYFMKTEKKETPSQTINHDRKVKYPEIFQPTETESFIFDGQTIDIPRCVVKFDKWFGEEVKETWGKKPSVCVDNRPMFAELAIMNYFIKDGWEARWIETYRGHQHYPVFLSDWMDKKYKYQIHNPIADKRVLKMLKDIAGKKANSYDGCWDVLAWKGEMFIFAESKRKSKDYINKNQADWLATGLKHGLVTDNFLVIKWDM
jgi:hypothetical protein